MPSKTHAYKMRAHIEKAAAALTDTEAVQTPELFPAWEHFRDYVKGDRCRDEGVLYRCLQDHTSQPMWTPKETPALWARVDDPGEEWPEWVQPVSAVEAYAEGAKVSHNGKHWISTVPANVWEPGVYGWEEQAQTEEPGETPDETAAVRWNITPALTQAFLDGSDYDPSDYTYSNIGNFAPATSDFSNTRPIGATVNLPAGTLHRNGYQEAVVGGETVLYNDVTGKVTPYAVTDENGAVIASGSLAPTGTVRWIKTNGTQNFRDIGGWPCDGGKVKYGLIYRSGNLAAADEDLICNQLGVKVEIDLTADGVPAFGGKLRHVCHPSYAMYSLADTEAWKTNLRAVFETVIYGLPVLVHCSMGADRTATLICILEGLLGVSQSNADKDYELTSFYNLRERSGNYQGGTADWSHLMAAISDLDGATFRDHCVSFALSLGFTVDEINAYRAAMIDGNPETITEPQDEPEPETPAVDEDNLIPLSINTDGTVFNGTGYKTGYKLKSNGTEAEASGFAVTGYIPFVYGQTIYVDRFDGSESSNGGIYFYGADFSAIACHRVVAMLTYAEMTAGEPLTYTPPPAVYDDGKGYVVDISNAAYIRLSVKTDNPQTVVCKIN